MEHTHSFGYWLRRRRKALDLTQAALAQQISCSLDLIQKIETDVRRPSRQIAEKLADALGLDGTERVAFVQAARAERAVNQLALPSQPIEPPQPVRTNLPTQLTALLGREPEVAAVCARLRRANVRLLTLTGPGGVGKTRLALQVAAELVADFPDGVYFVDLAPVRDPKLVSGTIAQTLGVREIGNQPLLERLKDELHDKHMVLLLDNFEHVLDAAAQVAELLAGTTRLKILVTSREHLHLRGEQEVVVPPLALPPTDDRRPTTDEQQSDVVNGQWSVVTQYAAVALFVERAQAVQPAFEVTNANASTIGEICVRLDGLPLAIELAAARIKLFPPEAMLARLDNQLVLLTDGPRDLPARQQTIRNTIVWSYDLLNEAAQTLFRRLGVFVGGCTLEAIDAIAAALSVEKATLQSASPQSPSRDRLASGLNVEQTASRIPANEHTISTNQVTMLDLVAALIDKNLLRQAEAPDGATRFVLLETIREYALERLEASGEAEQLRRQHAVYYLAHAEEQWSIEGSAFEAWEIRYRREYDNLSSALVWSQTLAGDAELTLRLANALINLWNHRGLRREAIAMLERSLNHPLGVGRTHAHATTRLELGALLLWTGQYAAAQQQYEQGLLIAQELGATELQAALLGNIGLLAREQGDSAAAWARLAESLAIVREFGHTFGIGIVLNTMVGVAIMDEDPARAEALLTEVRSVAQQGDVDHDSSFWALVQLGQAAQLRGDFERAAQIHQESLGFLQTPGAAPSGGNSSVCQNLGQTALGQNRPDEGRRWLAQALSVSQLLGDQASTSWCLAGLGTAAALNKEPEHAARLWGAAERLRQSIGCRSAPAARATYERAMAAARAQLGEEAFAAAWATGQALPLAQALAEAQGDNV